MITNIAALNAAELDFCHRWYNRAPVVSTFRQEWALLNGWCIWTSERDGSYADYLATLQDARGFSSRGEHPATIGARLGRSSDMIEAMLAGRVDVAVTGLADEKTLPPACKMALTEARIESSRRMWADVFDTFFPTTKQPEREAMYSVILQQAMAVVRQIDGIDFVDALAQVIRQTWIVCEAIQGRAHVNVSY